MKTVVRILALTLALMVLPIAAPAETAAPSDGAQRYYWLDYFTNTALDVSKYQGKALYLNIFYRGCPYCMQEMPDLKRIYDTYSPDEVAVVLIHAWNDEDATDTAAVVEQYGLQGIDIIEDEQLTLSNMLVYYGYPTSIFIGKDGYLSDYKPGMLTFEQMSAAMDAMGIGKRAGTAGGGN